MRYRSVALPNGGAPGKQDEQQQERHQQPLAHSTSRDGIAAVNELVSRPTANGFTRNPTKKPEIAPIATNPASHVSMTRFVLTPRVSNEDRAARVNTA